MTTDDLYDISELVIPPTSTEIAALIASLADSPIRKMIVRRLAFQLDRLKAGAFTPEELQGLCHSGLAEDDQRFEAFCDGCSEYQRKLFGRSREDSMRQDILDFGGEDG